MEKHTTKELCEQVLKIKYDTFTAHKKKYLDKLQLAYVIHIEEKNGTTYYYLEAKNNLYNILQCDIGKRDIKIIESILKVLIEGKIIPVQAELAKATNVPRGTIKGYIKFLKKHEIIAGPEIEQFLVLNGDTGEIVREYEKKKVAYVYYDIREDGSRIKLPHQNMIHQKHGDLWKEKFENQDYLHLVIRQLNYKPLLSVLRADVWDEMNNTFGLNNGTRTEMLLINSDIRQQLKEYFNQQDNVACVQ